MDARRNQVYTGIYTFENGELLALEDQMAISIDELLETLNAKNTPVTFLGDAVAVYRKKIEEKMQVPYDFAPAHVNKQRAGAVAALGAKYFALGKYETAREHQPDYLRASQAEREREEREARK